MTIELRDACNPPDITPMLIWTDIPYNTQKRMTGTNGSYRDDNPDTVLQALNIWSHLLHPDGTMVVCCDYRMAWHACDQLQHMAYRGEIIWEFGLGKPRESWWPVRHNNLLTFTHTETSGLFQHETIPRTRRLAPKPGYPADKPAGSVWDYTLNNNHPERVGYPNQKPLAIITPFILAHTRPGDLVADPFMGSGSTCIAAATHGREWYGCDNNPQAFMTGLHRIATERLVVG